MKLSDNNASIRPAADIAHAYLSSLEFRDIVRSEKLRTLDIYGPAIYSKTKFWVEVWVKDGKPFGKCEAMLPIGNEASSDDITGTKE